MGEIILITSGKGGTGKSTVTAGLGVMLSRYGKKVCMIDANIGMRDLDFICGLADRVFYNLYDLVQRGSKPEKVIRPVTGWKNLSLIPAPQTRSVQEMDPDLFRTFLLSIKPDYDYILIDGAPGCGPEFEYSSVCCDRAILVTAPNPSSLRAADRVRGLLKRKHIFQIALCVNAYPKTELERARCLGIDEITEIIPEELIAVLSEDDSFIKAWNAESLRPLIIGANGPYLEQMALRVCGEVVPIAVPQSPAASCEDKLPEPYDIVSLLGGSPLPTTSSSNGPELFPISTSRSSSAGSRAAAVPEAGALTGVSQSPSAEESLERTVNPSPESSSASSEEVLSNGSDAEEEILIRKSLFARIFGLGF